VDPCNVEAFRSCWAQASLLGCMVGIFWSFHSCAQRQVDSRRKAPAIAGLHVQRMGGVLGTPNAIRAAWEAYPVPPVLMQNRLHPC
jgi:hypothetical protein